MGKTLYCVSSLFGEFFSFALAKLNQKWRKKMRHDSQVILIAEREKFSILFI